MPAEPTSEDLYQDDKPQVLTTSTMTSIRTAAPRLLQRVQQGLSKFEMVYTPHPRWPLPNPKSGQKVTTPLRISVLDSSFNPPTLAHLSLANSLLPISKTSGTRIQNDYNAKLLLLSVKNVDKTLKPGDARYEQRLEMMYLLAKSMHPLRPTTDTVSSSNASAALKPEEEANVAIAIIDEPTFVGKSDVLRTFLRHHLSEISTLHVSIDDVELTFIVGLDTLERLFSPRYYPSEDAMLASLRKFLSPSSSTFANGPGDNSRIVNANRIMPSKGETTTDTKQELSELPHVKEFLNSERISVIDMGDELSTYSSTTVRRSVSSMGLDNGSAGSWRRLVTKDIAEYIVKERLYESEL